MSSVRPSVAPAADEDSRTMPSKCDRKPNPRREAHRRVKRPRPHSVTGQGVETHARALKKN